MENLNDLIEQKGNSSKPEDIEMVEVLKQEVQDIEDERDMAIARKYFAKVQIEGEKPTRFFCNLNKKRLAKAQFEESQVIEKNRDGWEEVRMITEQKSIEWEVRKYYWKLYGEHEARVDKEEILQSIEDLTKLETEDRRKLQCEITEVKVSVILRNTKKNVAPGPCGFGGSFYKVFWKYLKWIVMGAIKEIYTKRELPLSQRLGIIALIPKSERDQ